MTSAWYFKEPLRNETQNFLISKLCFPWLVYTLTPSNSTHYYLISSNLPFTTETTKKFPAEKKTTENLHMKSEHNFEWLHVGPTLLTLLCNILHDGDASSASSWRSNSFSARAPGTAYIACMTSTKLGIGTSLQPVGIFTFVTWHSMTTCNDSNAEQFIESRMPKDTAQLQNYSSRL